MKQTVEEAAYDYATQKTKFRKDVLKEVDADNYVSRHADSMEDFQCGYSYCKEQSPWISVKERLPNNDENIFYTNYLSGALGVGFYVDENGIKHIQEMIYMELPTGCQYQSLTNNK